MNMKSRVVPLDCKECEERKNCVFSNLEDCYLNEISDTKNANFYSKGSILFQENNYPLGLFGVFKGKVKLYKTSETGKEHILRLAKVGDVLGYRALISGEKYEVSAAALEDCYTCFIPKNIFLDILKSSPHLTHNIMGLLTSDLKVAEDKIADLAQKSVKERLAESLLMLRDYYGVDEKTQTINVTLSREDLANLVGTATETLIRTLTEFKKNELIALKGKKISLLKPKMLEELANI